MWMWKIMMCQSTLCCRIETESFGSLDCCSLAHSSRPGEKEKHLMHSPMQGVVPWGYQWVLHCCPLKLQHPFVYDQMKSDQVLHLRVPTRKCNIPSHRWCTVFHQAHYHLAMQDCQQHQQLLSSLRSGWSCILPCKAIFREHLISGRTNQRTMY